MYDAGAKVEDKEGGEVDKERDKGVHLVTVNDYLARRDAVWMGQIYDFLGLSVGVIVHNESFLYNKTHTDKFVEQDKERDEKGSFKVVNEFLKPCTRQEAYRADITYGTNNEFGFDYLRDNIEKDVTKLRQRDFHFAIVDEVDSILIDEARTPLIISAPYGESDSFYKKFAEIAKKLSKDTDYTIDQKFRSIAMTEEGINKVEKILGVENIYTEKGISFVHHLETAVKAEALFIKDKEYVVKDGEVVIVDEFTGRLQPGRRWSEGIHQAVEAKEGVKIEEETRTYASITFQNFFRMYQKLSGMTGTAKTSEEEFRKVYNLSVYEIPTNKPVSRVDHKDLIFRTEAGKFKAIAREVKEKHQKGQPVLIGTVSIEKNELLSKFLEIEGIPHEVLNAKNHTREGEIIAQAGKSGAVTIATNMAGRGVDIKLGGNPAIDEDYQKVKSAGGLFVLGTERHDARRIDNQLRGRSGRQGDPGDTRFFVSLEDHLMRVFANDMVKSMMVKIGLPEDTPIENSLLTRFIEQAQEKIEGFNFDARKHVLEFDDVLNHQRKIFYQRRRNILTGGPEATREYILNVLLNFKEEEKEVFEKRLKEEGEEFLNSLRWGILEAMDMFWMEHLDTMDYIRSSVNLRAYGQRDPLTEYKKEGLRLFKEMEMSIEDQVVKIIPQVTVGSVKDSTIQNVVNNLVLGRQEDSSLSEQNQKDNKSVSLPVANKEFSSVGRNDPCPCGSGKKFKKCHGK
jgi:preprotein translocase subunit SecA